MSEKFENALSSLQLQSQSSSEIFKQLHIIRKEVEWPKHKDNIAKLRESGCLRSLISTLNSVHKNILDLTLSILGNCFMDRSFTRHIFGQYNILSPLNHLLKKNPKEDSINGRIFRIIGNICQHRDQWANIIIDLKPQIVTLIVDYVKRISMNEPEEKIKTSEATVVMAIRALKSLLNSQTVIALVKSFGVLKAVGSLFIKCTLEWQSSKKRENALINIIKLIQEYSRYKYYHSIIEMRNTERGDSLLHLSNVLILAPKRVVKIVMNFIRISQQKSELPIPEICDKFIDVLQNHSIVKELKGECVEYLQCLCYLLDNPANRNNDRCGKCIPLLLQVLKEYEELNNSSLECCILIVAALNKCKYHEALVLEQIRCNAVQILTEKLFWLSGASNKTLKTDHKDEKKRKYKFGHILSPLNIKRDKRSYSPVNSDEEQDGFLYNRFDRSPSPSSSSDSEIPSQWSPISSPKSTTFDLSESDSDDYSPVCSEVDPCEFQLGVENDTYDPVSESVDLEEDVNDDAEIVDKISSSNLRIKLLVEIVKLLKSYIKLRPPSPQLACPDLLIALLQCSGHFEWEYSTTVDTVDVICRILDSHEYLVPLMQTDFIETVFDLTQLRHNLWCTKCSQFQHVGQTILKKFSFLAESGIGKGDIAHKLLRGDLLLKQQLVLTLPYIVGNRTILGKLMLNCGGLDILMNLLQDTSEFKNRSIKVLCAMACRKLAIVNPKKSASGLNRPKVIADKYRAPETLDESVVTFLLDDGGTLRAYRDFLSEKSEFFSRMLNGGFKESTEDVISLHNVDLKSMRCLLHLLKCVDKNETIEIDLELDTLLDVIVLSDRFLMGDLCLCLTDCVEQFRISSETVPIIYKWSLESGTNLLRVETVAFALVGNIADEQRYAMFESLFNLGYSKQLLEDFRNLLVRYLSITEMRSSERSLKRKHSGKLGTLTEAHTS